MPVSIITGLLLVLLAVLLIQNERVRARQNNRPVRRWLVVVSVVSIVLGLLGAIFALMSVLDH